MMRRALLLVLGLSGCGSEPVQVLTTADLATSEILLAVSARGNGEAVMVSAELDSTRGDTRVLAHEDRLVASAEDAVGQGLGAYDTSSHATLLPTAKTQITLTLVRADEQVSADVDLPPPFTLAVPAGPVSAAAAIPLSWEAADAGDAMTLDVWGPCVAPLSRGLVSDTGSYEIQPGDLAFTQGGCVIAVSLTRSRAAGPLALAATGSSASSAQVRTAAIEVVP